MTCDEPLVHALNDLQAEVRAQPYPLIFITVSGAHLYGFPSRDSDFDLRGAHVIPAREVLGLRQVRETIENKTETAGLEIETVTHDVRKYVRLLLKRNGYVLEQLYSPLIVQTTPQHEEIKRLGRGCVTPQHALHYLGFAHNEWKLLEKRPSLKRLLYVYRVLLTGIHLMRTGEVEANLVRLNEEYKLPQVPDLIAQKINGTEWEEIAGDLSFHHGEYERLCRELQDAATVSTLPKGVSTEEELNELVVQIRLESIGSD
ncbi:MAG TPA: nucleotidyltransferase domain-containing protein [Dehalococcoidia bacterium]|nr:nucleotidyltransferase domain-containing protein [Dehalococcoidia bacterium]